MAQQKENTPNGTAHHDQPFDFQHDATWRIFRVMSEFTEGLEFIASLKRPVTFFGSARTPKTDQHYKDAVRLAKKLGLLGYTIVTGGGGGIMEAANRGAVDAKAPSVGLNIQLPFEQRMNKYVKKGVGFYYFFSRKSMLSTSAQAYIVFPGGFGTMDELFTILILFATKKIEIRPIILFGSDYWKPFDEFIRTRMLQEEHAIRPDDEALYTITDSIDEATKIIQNSKEREFTFM